ncbi:MAG: type II secretion system protein [Patescibacteria group bacterium]|nr:type II secretion system protein [Patescibacteria group bacterium]
MKARKGFTLIELLVVIAIIGLLSTLAIVALSSARSKARDSKRTSDMKQVQTALELYFNDKQYYPLAASAEIGSQLFCLDSASGWKTTQGSCASPLYLASAPRDPDNVAAGVACAQGGSATTKCNYAYFTMTAGSTCAANCNNYNIHFRLENDPDGATGPLIAGVNCTTETGIYATCLH